jgi:hypothetical protein
LDGCRLSMPSRGKAGKSKTSESRTHVKHFFILCMSHPFIAINGQCPPVNGCPKIPSGCIFLKIMLLLKKLPGG